MSPKRSPKGRKPGRAQPRELDEARSLLDAARRKLESGVEAGATVARYQHLVEIAASLLSAGEIDQLLERILSAAIEMTQAERGLILLRGEATGELAIRAASAAIDAATREDALAYSRGVIDGTIRDGRTLLCDDAAADARFRDQRSVIDLGILSLLCVPLRAGREGRIVGTLYLDNRTTRGIFTPQDVGFMEGLAGIASLALAQLRTVEGLRRENVDLRRAVRRRFRFPELVGDSAPMQDLFLRIRQLLDDDSTVLITGETGTGKEMVARAIHFNGPRRKEPFLALNCAALSENLLESELFGHVRGAFTGAHADKPGLLEVAGAGTVLLDDVDQLGPAVQSKLLRVLQERELRRVGGVATVPVRARVLCAANRDLRRLAERGAFRQDLYYRISVIPLQVPPLRDRREDIPLLVAHFLKRFNAEKGRRVTIGDAALDLLARHDWPGNVRQLEHEIERLVVFAEEGDALRPENLSEEIRAVATETPAAGTGESGAAPARTLQSTLKSYERFLVQQALDRERGNVTRAAQQLGMTRQGLQQKMKRLGLERPSR